MARKIRDGWVDPKFKGTPEEWVGVISSVMLGGAFVIIGLTNLVCKRILDRPAPTAY